MIFIKVDAVNEFALRAAIRFACENNGTAPDECYEVIGRKILNGQSTAICGSWHDAFVAFYYGATSIMVGLCASPANEATNAERAQYDKTVELQQKRIEELEKRIAGLTAPVTVNGKTPGQLARVSAECNSKYTAYYVWLDLGGEEDACKVATGIPRDHADKLANKINARAFGQPSQTTRDALRKVQDRLNVYEINVKTPVGQEFAGVLSGNIAYVIDDEIAKLEAKPMTGGKAVAMCEATKDAARRAFPDEPQKRFKYERAWLSEQTDDTLFDLYMEHVGFFDMNGTMLERENMIETLAAIEQEQAITLPTKPTKPLRERLEDLASYWEKGAASSSMSEGYRQASKDCAKELREVINDPR